MTGTGHPETSTGALHEPELPCEPDSDKVYYGSVKSYNDRRGFGFIACSETAAEFGRDVYMAKVEGQLAAAGIRFVPGEDPQCAVDRLHAQKDASGGLPRLAEEDLVQFMVKLSVEGFPQAVQVQRLRKFHGLVQTTPKPAAQKGSWHEGLLKSPDVEKVFGGVRQVVLPQEAAGQIRLDVGDKVTFCLPEELSEQPPAGKHLQAKLVMLVHSERSSGAVLGCCKLRLPRPSQGEGKPTLAPLVLDCHAFNSKLILSGLTVDVGEAELMRFFSKQGANKGIVAHARSCSFASISFPGFQEVCTFLARSAHAFADDKETRIATLHSQDGKHYGPEGIEGARLPALPAPMMQPGEDPGSILVSWARLQLAVGYVVEIRPSGTTEAWAPVEPGRLAAECSTCKVSGLRPGFAYEARMSYWSSCGCRSEVSDASQPCPPCGEGGEIMPSTPPPEVAIPAMAQGYGQFPPPPVQQQQQAWQCVNPAMLPPGPPEVMAGDEAGFSVAIRWPSVPLANAYVVELREAGSMHVERFVRSAAPGAPPGALVELRVGGLRPSPGRIYTAQFRCVWHDGSESMPSAPGTAALPPFDGMPPMAGAAPGVMPGCMPPQPHGGCMPPPPQPHGCMPPPPQWMPGNVPPHAPRPDMASTAPQHNPPVQMPAGFAYANGGNSWPYSCPLPDASPLSVHIAPSPAADGSQPGAAESALAAAVKDAAADCMTTPPVEIPLAPAPGAATGAPLMPPPNAPPGATNVRKEQILEKVVAVQKEIPPEVTGQEECLILD